MMSQQRLQMMEHLQQLMTPLKTKTKIKTKKTATSAGSDEPRLQQEQRINFYNNMSMNKCSRMDARQVGRIAILAKRYTVARNPYLSGIR